MGALVKRLVGLSQILVIIFLVAVVGAFRRCGAVELRDDAIALRSLDEFGALAASKGDLDATLTNADTVVALREWLTKHDAANESARVAARKALSTWLTKQCAGTPGPNACLYEPKHFGKSAEREAHSGEISLVVAHLAGTTEDARHARTVDEDLDALTQWSRPLEVSWVGVAAPDDWDADVARPATPEPGPPPPADAKPSSAGSGHLSPIEAFDGAHPPPPSPSQPPPLTTPSAPAPSPDAGSPRVPRIDRIALTDEGGTAAIWLVFEDSQGQGTPEGFKLRAKTSKLAGAGPTLLELRAADLDEDVARLPKDLGGDQRARLRQKYGALPTDKARDIVTDELGDAYKSVDLLGFSVLPTFLPLTILIVELAVMLLMLVSLRHARAKHASLGAEELEDAIFPVLQSLPLRAALWIVLPVASVWVTQIIDLAALTHAGWGRAMLFAGTLGLLAVGIASTRIANQLWSATPARTQGPGPKADP